MKKRIQIESSGVQYIAISNINLNESTRIRAAINPSIVEDYALGMKTGGFPPVDLFRDGDRFFVGDGLHRILAAQKNGEATVAAVVHDGGRLGAIRWSMGANKSHGLNRTYFDDENAVVVGLKEFPKLSDQEIAELCGTYPARVKSFRDWMASKPGRVLEIGFRGYGKPHWTFRRVRRTVARKA